MVRTLIKCVVVLYKMRPDEAKSLSTLLEICSQDPAIGHKIDIFIQDNSPDSCPPILTNTTPAVEYYHDPTNPGLAAAYNRALAMSKAREIPWLLLLDQDTTLDVRYLHLLLEAVEGDLAAQVCAFVPKLVNDGRVCSPHRVHLYTYIPLPAAFCGFTTKPIVPCNSASCLKVEALELIGGFPEHYRLDFLDLIVFHRLQASGGRVYVLDSRLEHHLSLLNMEAEMPLPRYSKLLSAEWMYIRETGARGGPSFHRLRLLKRALQHAVRLRNKGYAAQTLRAAVSIS